MPKRNKLTPISFSVGICAYNEEANIGKLIKEIFAQNLSPQLSLAEIIVVASGCTDRTVEIVKDWQKKEPKIKLIVEKTRRGKAAAVNVFLKNATSKYLILESADTLPAPDCFSLVLTKLQSNRIGMVGCRVVPKNDPSTFMGFANQFLWLLHHNINIQYPTRSKVGELVAFKKIFERIPRKSAADEANIEPLIIGQDYLVTYCPEAIVYNMGPEVLMEYLSRRRRNFAGHTRIWKTQGYKVLTYSNSRVLGVFLSSIEWSSKRHIVWSLMVILLEAVARLLGKLDANISGKNLSVWKIAKSSKQL